MWLGSILPRSIVHCEETGRREDTSALPPHIGHQYAQRVHPVPRAAHEPHDLLRLRAITCCGQDPHSAPSAAYHRRVPARGPEPDLRGVDPPAGADVDAR